MRINIDSDQIENAVDLLRKISQQLTQRRDLVTWQSLTQFSNAGGLDEAGERLSPIGDERAPEANQAIALYLKHTADNLWICLLYTSPSPRDS